MCTLTNDNFINILRVIVINVHKLWFLKINMYYKICFFFKERPNNKSGITHKPAIINQMYQKKPTSGNAFGDRCKKSLSLHHLSFNCVRVSWKIYCFCANRLLSLLIFISMIYCKNIWYMFWALLVDYHLKGSHNEIFTNPRFYSLNVIFITYILPLILWTSGICKRIIWGFQ